MRIVAGLGGMAVVAGLVVLAVAGFPGAVPLLVSAAALVAMVGLGSSMGGRHTANVPPVAVGRTADGPGPEPSDAGADPADESAGGATADP
jgi:hypothetical protein